MKSDEKFFVHEKGMCDSPNIGEGTRVWAFAHVLKGARVGAHCNLGEHVFVENDVVIGNGCTIKNGVSLWDRVTLEDNVFVGPHAVFTNELRPRAFIKRGPKNYLPTTLKKGCTIGANATIVCGVVIGEYAMIGAGAVVTKDVPPHTLVVGNPARFFARICYCGEPMQKDDFCRACEKPLKLNDAESAKKLAESRVLP